jgi:L-iditol 2-dehydrogenase
VPSSLLPGAFISPRTVTADLVWQATQSGGSVLIVGMGTPNHLLPISEAFAREVSLVPSWRYADAYPRAIEIATAATSRATFDGVKLPDLQSLITHHYNGLGSVPGAFQFAGQTAGEDGRLVIKTAISFPEKVSPKV